MPLKAANDNHPRPDGFDAALERQMPVLRRYALRLTRDEDRAEDLNQDALANILQRANKCRMETFKTWANLTLFGTFTKGAKLRRAQKRTADVVSMTAFDELPNGMQATQHESAELAEVVGKLEGREGVMVMRAAMGETLEEIGRDYGIGKERVRQLIERERKRLVALMEVG